MRGCPTPPATVTDQLSENLGKSVYCARAPSRVVLANRIKRSLFIYQLFDVAPFIKASVRKGGLLMSTRLARLKYNECGLSELRSDDGTMQRNNKTSILILCYSRHTQAKQQRQRQGAYFLSCKFTS